MGHRSVLDPAQIGDIVGVPIGVDIGRLDRYWMIKTVVRRRGRESWS